jgi:AsmA-like C-terminal region
MVAVLWAISFPAIAKWGFGRDKIATDLARATSGEVQFHSFRNVYFPHPGCVAEGVTIRRKGGEDPPLVSIDRLTILSSISGIVRRRVRLMKVEGLKVTPGGEGWPINTNTSTIVIEKLIADDAVLQILQDDHGKPLNFQVQKFNLENVGDGGAMPFRVQLTNPIPPGEVEASGKLGPWNTRQREETPIEGSYTFRHANLGVISGIGGELSSDGKFRGTIRQLNVQGSTDTPQFQVHINQHRFPLHTEFIAEVNATNGDVILHHIDAKLLDTEIALQGEVVPDPHHRRTATLDFESQQGRIQDILFPFVKDPRSPVTGVTSFRGRVILPAGKEPFEEKVALKAEFGIANAHLTNPQKQQDLNKASERARGNPDDDHPENVLSDLKGNVDLKAGVARFSSFSFSVPGALASMHGTYALQSERINLHGTLRLQAKLTDTTNGFKGFLLKAISPFIKKNNKPQEPLPIAVTGTYDHPQYQVSITKDTQHRHGM